MAPAKSVSASATSLAHSMMMPRCTMSITRTKGLLNMPGQNNCFLNSAVQVLWHLDIFRRSFRDLSGHICMSDSCIFCALKELFAQFQYSQESALPPDALRRALAETFFDQRRFQLGYMDDAAECFENILQRIHFHIASQEVEDMCNVAHCIPHQKFAMTLVEQTVCHVCGASSEPLPFTQMVHYVSASALCLQASLVDSKEQKPVSFGELLRRAGGMGDIRDCPSSCGAKIQICKTLMNRPDIVSLGLVWDSERPSVDHIVDVLDSIGMTVNMDEMFHKVVDTRWASTVTHHLVGIVTYYGKHYSTFFFHTKLCVWIYFDDATVREIGPHWQQVVDKCHRGHFQPLLLLYANPNGTPVSTATAPTSVIHYISEHKKKQMDLKRSTSEKHRYGQQNGKKSEQLPAGMHIAGDASWSRGSYLTNKKGISMGGRSAVQEPLPILDMAFAHCAKPRARTYSDTSIMSERPYEPHGSGSDLEAQHAHTLEGARRVARQAGRDNTSDVDINSTYISRQAVESVLSLQHKQRQRTLHGANTPVVPGSRNSSSSLESFENSLHMREKASDCVDGTCRRRDSGNWSGDRNSASSASSTSLDGSYYCASGVRRACGSPGRPVNNFSKHEYSNIGMLVDKGYDSYSLSSTDSYPSAGMPGSPAKADPRLQQIPEAVHISNRLERAIHHSLLLGSDSASDSVFDDVFTSGKGEEEESQDCDKLCSQAEMCLKMSYEKEQAGDLKMAIFFSDSAAAKARAAMDAPYGNAQSLIAAKMKHSMSVMRSSNLSKRLKEAEERRRGKESNGYDAHHSRQGSRDSTHSRHTRQGSRDSACTVIDLSEPVKSIEIYATLPKKSSKKKSALFAQSSLRLKDGVENYKDFLAEQWHTSSQDDMAIKMMSDGEYTLNPKTKMRNGVGSHGETNGTKMKDPEFSDYSSEWEQSKKPSLHRTLSNPTGMKNHDAEDGSNASASMKKQHRIRRKLMGGFMRRKNRSLPDLREGKDAPQAESRALDDTVIFDAKNECGMKQESSNEDEAREDHSATIKRCGFHQPHRAFVSRNYAQRPLLTKVDPPQVDGVTSSASLHQKNTACEQQDDSSKQTPCWPQPRQQPSEGVIASTTLHHRNTAFEQQEPSAIQVPCWPQTRQKPPEMFGNKTVGVDIGGFSDAHMPNPALNLPKGFNANQGTALEPNSFLTELHNKRTQILKSLPKSTDNVRNYQGGEPATPVKLEQHSSSAPSGNNWLCELQSKQMAMLKKGDHVDDVKTTCDKDMIPSGKDEALRQPLMYCATQVANRNAYPAESQATQSPNGVIQSSDEQHNESAEEQEDIKPKSVKDLALRFEKILRPAIPDQEVSTVREELQLSAAKEPSFIANKGAPASAGNLVTPRDYACESQAMSASSLAMRSERTSASASLQTGSENTCQGRPFGTPQFTQPAAAPCHRTANSASHSQPMAPAGQTCQPHNLAKPLCSSGSLPPSHQAPISPPAPCPINSVRHHASFTRPFVPQTSFQSTSPVIGTIHGPSNHLAPSHGDSVLVASSIGVSSHGASSSGGGSYGTASYEQKPRPPSAQQQYGKAFQYVKSDPAETRSFSMVRGHPAVPVVGETTLHTTSPSNSDSSKRPTRPPDYETALQRLEMIKEQQRTTSPDTFQFPAKTPPDVLQGQQLPQPEMELGKMRKTALKKCVTFSDEVVLVACAEEEEDDYVPNPLLERVYRQHAAKQDCSRECHETSQFEDISSVHSSDSCDSVCHVDSVVKPHDSSQVPCNLCHKKFVSPPTVYCPDCAFYMSRFQKRT